MRRLFSVCARNSNAAHAEAAHQPDRVDRDDGDPAGERRSVAANLFEQAHYCTTIARRLTVPLAS